VLIDSNPYFVGKDVAEILGYTDTDQALRKHIDPEDKLLRPFDGSGQNRNMVVINESGLYSLVFSRKSSTAKQVKKWIASEVLPAARKLQTQLDGVSKTSESVQKDDEINNIAPVKNDFVAINGYQLSVKEYRGQRVVTFPNIDEIHRRPEGTARKRFNDNRQYFNEGEDFFKITPSVFRTAIGGKMDARQMNDITLITESGYAMLVKSFTDSLSWAIQRKLVDTYFHVYNSKAETAFPSMDDLSPALKMCYQMLEAITETQRMAREAKKESAEAKQQIAITHQTAEKAKQQSDSVSQEISGIRDIVTYHPDKNWRKENKTIISHIVQARGGSLAMYAQVYNECYALVDDRAGASLQTRLTNKQKRMQKEGASKTQCSKLTKLDILEEDPRLLEIYIAVVKEMAIQHGVDLPEQFRKTEIPIA